jgi:hypothetical protein
VEEILGIWSVDRGRVSQSGIRVSVFWKPLNCPTIFGENRAHRGSTGTREAHLPPSGCLWRLPLPARLHALGGPVIEGGDGLGFVFPQEMEFPGTVVAPNITPDKETGIGNWTDGEIIRAIREGVSRDGSALFPMMPYANFRHMSDEDVYALVAYLRTLPPAKNVLPRSQINFPVSMFIKSVPKPAGQVPPVDGSNQLKYGEYLTKLGGCGGCHTPMEKGEPLPGKWLAGGEIFRTPMGTVVSANITPDKDTGIGKWSEQDFLNKFYQYRKYVEKGSPKIGPESFTLMPWLPFCQLPEEDLKAIFAFLKTQPAVYNAVETHPAHLQPVKPVS